MKLVSGANEIVINFSENQVNVICIENRQFFRTVIEDLINQSTGGTGQFVIYDNEKEIAVSKVLDFIISPYMVDVNNKKITNKITSELVSISKDELFQESLILHSKICEYLLELTGRTDYNLEFNTDLNISGLLKCYDIKMANDDMDVIERVIEYIKAMHRICGIQLFAFLNLKQYLNKYELDEFYKSVFYEKVYVILIEGSCTEKRNEENVLIIDSDLCFINP